ncbi:MAG: hypothetical protein QM572_11185 [Nocardioides sp.]
MRLTQAGLDDVFDLYVSPDVKIEGEETTLVPTTRSVAEATPRGISGGRASATVPLEASCSGTASVNVADMVPAFAISPDPGNHFNYSVKKKEIDFFPDVPVGVEGNVRLALDSVIDYKIGWDLDGECSVEFGFTPWVSKPILVDGVPFLATASLTAKVARTGRISAGHGGGASTLGFEGSFAFGEGDGKNDLHSVESLEYIPDSAQGTAGMSIAISGSVGFGPGAGTEAVGAIAGVQAIYTPLSLSVDWAAEDDDSPTCAQVKAGKALKVGMFAKAWGGPLSLGPEWNVIDKTWPDLIDAKFPSGCDEGRRRYWTGIVEWHATSTFVGYEPTTPPGSESPHYMERTYEAATDGSQRWFYDTTGYHHSLSGESSVTATNGGPVAPGDNCIVPARTTGWGTKLSYPWATADNADPLADIPSEDGDTPGCRVALTPGLLPDTVVDQLPQLLGQSEWDHATGTVTFEKSFGCGCGTSNLDVDPYWMASGTGSGTLRIRLTQLPDSDGDGLPDESDARPSTFDGF